MPQEQFIYLLAKGLRIGASLQWSIFIFWILRNGPRNVRAQTLLAFSVAVIAYLLVPLPFKFGAPIGVSMFFLVLTYLTIPLIWVTSCAQFQDDFRLEWSHWAVVLVVEVICLCTVYGVPTSVWLFKALEGNPDLTKMVRIVFPQILTLLFAVLALIQVRRGAVVDLVESRLRFRKTFVLATGSLMIFVIICETISKLLPVLQYLDSITASLVFLCGYIFSHQAQNKGPAFFEWPSEIQIDPAAPKEPLGPDAQALLQRMIEQEKVFLRPDMSLNQLSLLLKLPEYRVRRHINGSLGFQNFNQFLIHHRIAEAKRILGEDENGQLAIYNVAMDLGFGSLSSFNRIFKESVGQSPTQFRQSRR